MKKVPAKGVTFLCGSSLENPAPKYKPYLASFSYDYYLGIYPVTQGQQLLIDGQTHSQFTSGEDAALRPVDNYLWGDIRNWKAWPGEYSLITSTMGCSIGRFRRFGLVIDLPTSTEWEYACRAGKWTRFGNGTDDETGMDRMGWYSGNAGGTTQPVGRKDPNDWGFYDMCGSLYELCLDYYVDDLGVEHVYEPVGPASGEQRVTRGGCYLFSSSYSRSASRHRTGDSSMTQSTGARFVCPACLKWPHAAE